MLYVGFMKRSIGSLTSTTSTIMNSAAKNIILTELVNVKLLVWGREILQCAGGRTVSIMLIHKTNGDYRGGFFLFWLFTYATGSRFYETEN